MPDPRPDWTEYFLGVAVAVSARSDCERSKVGAVIVKDRRIRSTGYNASPAGRPGCSTCPRRLSNCEPGSDYNTPGPNLCVALHAEQNAIIHADRADLIGATMYVTRAMCNGCAKLAEGAGFQRVVWPEGSISFTTHP